MTKSVKFLLCFLLILAAGAAALLAHSTIEGTKPIAATAIAAREQGVLPPLPTIGLPGAVEPEEELLDVAPTTAKEINDSRPFSTEAIIPALPFSGAPAGDDGERAAACLATAGWYEAGADSGDQSAVMQVVLNRVRHKAFPNSICGVVFQGAERRTGCQFSFTCDGAMTRRRPSPAAWSSAMGLARAMLDGYVDERVGLATHFHTDWVVPYWSSSLVKLTNVRTHLFFRWEGFWGTPRAFLQAPASKEPRIAALASRFPLHGDTALLALDEEAGDDLLVHEDDAGHRGSAATDALSARTLPAARPAPALPQLDDVTLRRLDPAAGASAGRWALDAVSLCANVPVCRVVGWSDRAAAPSGMSRGEIAAAPPDLVFVKISRDRQEKAHWDCSRWPRASTSECLGSARDTVRLLFGD